MEFYLIVVALAFPFLYFVFRALIWDTFIWIMVVPVACYLYAFALRLQGMRFLNYHLNSLDKIFLLYLTHGVVITFIGVVIMGYGTRLGITPFIHYYLPTVIYFVARSYTKSSGGNVFGLAKIMWVLAIILIVDVFVEYYIVEVKELPLSIPWVRLEADKIPNMTPEIWHELSFGKVLSILSGRKITGMVAISLFAFILPFFYVRKSRLRQSGWQRSVIFNSALNAVILASLLICAFIALNKTAIMASLVVVAIGLIYTRSFKLLALLSIVSLIGAAVSHEFLWQLIQHNFIREFAFGDPENPKTVLEHTIGLDRIRDGYLNIELSRLILGTYGAPTELQSNFFISTFTTELRAFIYPSVFGLGWALIVSAGLIVMVRYSYALIKTPNAKLLGLAFLGLLIIFATDLHYPSFIVHGPLELLFVTAGGLASLRDSVKNGAQSTNLSAPVHGPLLSTARAPGTGP